MKYSMVKVEWLDWTARDDMGSEWLKVFGSVDDLPEFVHVETDLEPSQLKAYIEGRYGYRVHSWSYCEVDTEAKSMADSLYSGDPV